jgi:hypothetical protein
LARFIIRKLGSNGDTCVAVAEQELEDHLRTELGRGYSVALRTEEVSSFVGGDLERVMVAVRAEVVKGVEQMDLLLIPPVAGG